MPKNKRNTQGHKERLNEIKSREGYKSDNALAVGIGAGQSDISKVTRGIKAISASLASKIVKKHSHYSYFWVYDGIGEMLKFENFDEKQEVEYDPELSIENGYFFPSNLEVLLSEYPEQIPPIIRHEPNLITSLAKGNIRPSVSVLVRLHRSLGISLDTLLFRDLRSPENMLNEDAESFFLKKLLTQQNRPNAVGRLDDGMTVFARHFAASAVSVVGVIVYIVFQKFLQLPDGIGSALLVCF